jgi:predicted dehydrogenase
VEESNYFTLRAVYSRSESSASALASKSKSPIDTYFDAPTSDKSLDVLLKRGDISAIIIALPITSQPPIIRKALAAGKHVLSEKPIAKDIETAKELITYHKGLESAAIWAVGENLRFVDAVAYGAEKVREIGGEVVTYGMEMFTLIKDDDKFFNTSCKRCLFSLVEP